MVKLTVLPDGTPRDKVYCPGFLSRLPQVKEAYHAYSARKDGMLPIYYPGRELIVLEATDLATIAVNKYEASVSRKLRHTASGG